MTYSIRDLVSPSTLEKLQGKYLKIESVEGYSEELNACYEARDALAIISIYDENRNITSQRIELFTPQKGFFLPNSYYFNKLICVDKIKEDIFYYYDFLGEDIDDDREHFINNYNSLLSELYDYLINFAEIKEHETDFINKYGQYDFQFNLYTETRPLDFITTLNEILYHRYIQSEKNTIVELENLEDLITTERKYSPNIIISVSRQILMLNRNEYKFDEIKSYLVNKNRPLLVLQTNKQTNKQTKTYITF